MPEWSLQQALNDALRVSLTEDSRTLVFGEDVGVHGGVFRITDGLQREFGAQRVFDTPLAEAAIVGTAVGLCLKGFRPIVEMQFAAFGFPAFNQIAMQVGRLRTRSRGAFHLPLTIRMPSYGGFKGPESHSESVEATYAHLPGIKVAAAATPNDGHALLLEAVRDPDPVVFLEPISRYWGREPQASSANGDGAASGGEYASRVVHSGDHVTLVAWGACVQRCLQAAEFAAEDGVSVEVLDLRWLKPLDITGIAASVKRTQRAVIVQEGPVTAGLGAEVSAVIMEHCFGRLVSPVVRVAAPDVPYPPAALEDEFLPDADRILTAIAKTLEN